MPTNPFAPPFIPAADLALVTPGATDSVVGVDETTGNPRRFPVGFNQGGAGSVSRTLKDKLSDAISVKDFGAKGDGVTDDAAAIQKAIDFVSASGGGTVYFPPGSYSLAVDLVPTSNVRLLGAGRMGAKLVVPVGSTTRNTLIVNLSNPVSNFTIESLGFEGRWNDTQSELAANGLITLKFITNLVIRDCWLRYSRAFTLNINECSRVRVEGCLLEYGARDFVAVWGTPDVQIVNNVLRGNDDDGISVNWETAGSDPVRSQIVITGNVLEDTGSIRTQAPKNVLIANNTIRRPKGSGVQLGINNTSTNDISSGHGIIIADNLITDVIDRQWFVSGDQVGSVNNRIYIAVRSIQTRAGALAVAPGEINTATGSVQSPYDYYYKRGSIAAATGSLRAPECAIIRGNICKRTLPAVSTYGAWGYGQAYSKNGFVNYQVPDAVMMSIGVRVELPWTSMLIESNIIQPGRYGIEFTLATGASLVSKMAKGVVIRGNQIKDTDLYGIKWSNTASLTYQDISLIENTIDCDPYFLNGNRGANGTWATDTTPVAINAPNLGGVVIERNRIRNSCSAIVQTGASSYQYVRENLLFGDASAAGFSISNKGIGNVPAIGGGESWWLQFENSDPTSASYGASLGTNIRNTSGMPSAGKWLSGMVVASRASAISGAGGSQYNVIGYRRLTSGSSHVLNTDWAELRCLTGT